MNVKRIGLVALAVAVAGSAGFLALRRDPAVTVATLAVGDVVEAIYSTGTVASERAATLRATVPGTVRPLALTPGDRVTAGQTVIALDAATQRMSIDEAEANLQQARASVAQATSNLELLRRGARPEELDQARASLRQARSDLKTAQSDLRRTDGLFREAAATQAQLETAQQNAESLAARVSLAEAQLALLERGNRKEQVAQSEAQLDIARAQLAQREAQLRRTRRGMEDYELGAPFAGILSSYLVSEGDAVTPGTALATLVDPARFVVKTPIDEVDILKVRSGQEALVSLDALPGKTFEGRVERVVPKTDPVAKTSEVVVRLAAPPERLLDGLTATVNIITSRRRALTVPASGVVRAGEERSVWRVGSDNRLSSVTFTVGVQDGDRLEATGKALQAGDRIVVEPSKKLAEGKRVTVRKP